LLECYSKGLVRSHKVIIRAPPLQMGEQLWRLLDAIPNFGSSALPVLSNKEKATRTGLVRQLTPTHCVKDDFLGELSLNAVLHWFLGGSIEWPSTQSAEEPEFCVTVHRFGPGRF